jgi:hypothetical protein
MFRAFDKNGGLGEPYQQLVLPDGLATGFSGSQLYVSR